MRLQYLVFRTVAAAKTYCMRGRELVSNRSITALGKNCSYKSLPASSVIFLACVFFVISDGRAQDDRSPGATDTTGLTVYVDLRPFTDPQAKFITLQGNGQLHVTRYIPARELVTGASRQVLADDVRQRFLSHLQTSAFQHALRTGDFSGSGLTGGDQFSLRLARPHVCSNGEEAWGFSDNAPAAIQTFIAELNQQEKTKTGSISIALPDGFVRAQRVPADQAQALKKAGKARLTTLAGFPPDVRRIVDSAIQQPLVFHPLTHSQRTYLRDHRPPGADWYAVMADGNSMFQLTVFSTK